MPNWTLKDAAAIIAAPICHLFNSSLRDSYIPTLWKSANVCPMPKTKPTQNLSKDLRSIFLTPVLAKMLEHYPIQIPARLWIPINLVQWKAVAQLLHIYKLFNQSIKQQTTTGIMPGYFLLILAKHLITFIIKSYYRNYIRMEYTL